MNSPDFPNSNLEVPPKRAKLVFFDSTDLHWCPEVGFSYVSKGHQTQVESPGNANPWYALFGSLVYPEGSGLYTIHERKRHQEVRAHLERLVDSDPNVFWLVIMDNASAHTTPKLDKFWEQHRDRLSVVSLPTYSPHLNLIERLWRVMRGQLTKNQFYPSLTELAQAVVEWFETFPISRFCSLMGVDETPLIFV